MGGKKWTESLMGENLLKVQLLNELVMLHPKFISFVLIYSNNEIQKK